MTAEPSAEELDYRPLCSAEHVRLLRSWHDRAYDELRAAVPCEMSYLGLDLAVPEGVFPPAPMSELLGRAVLAEVRPGERVLDMGTGSGVNALLAATRAGDVVGVDVNPAAVGAAEANARRNGIAARVRFFESDVFDAVEGAFDVIVFDPPFRWFTPRDGLEAAMADPGYRALTRFMKEAGRHLRPAGRILLFFGTTGDIDYLYRLVEECGFTRTVLDSRQFVRDDVTVCYFAFRLDRAHPAPGGA